MIRKIFNSDSNDRRALEVGRNGSRPWLNIRDVGGHNTMFLFTQSTGAALALAVLEAAGYDDMADDMTLAETYAFDALHSLQRSIDEQEHATAEAKEQAELEAEALELVNAWHESGNCAPYLHWDALNGSTTGDYWLAVARKAREIAGRTEK